MFSDLFVFFWSNLIVRVIYLFFLVIITLCGQFVHGQNIDLASGEKFVKDNAFFDKDYIVTSKIIEKILIVYDSSIEDIEKGLKAFRSDPFGKNCKTEFNTIAEIKENYGKKVFDENKNILEFLGKKNAGLLFLVNKRSKNILEGYLYEGLQGNCLAYREVTVKESSDYLNTFAYEFFYRTSFYKKKMDKSASIVFIKSSMKMKEMLILTRFSQFAAYMHFLLTMNSSIILLMENENKEKFLYSTSTKSNNLFFLEKLDAESKALRFLYLKNNEINKTEIGTEKPLAEVYEEISKKLVEAYNIKLDTRKDNDVYDFIETFRFQYSHELFRISLKYFVSPFKVNSSSEFISYLTADRMKNYFNSNDKTNIITIDKYDVELAKLDFLKDELEVVRARKEFYGRSQNLGLVYETNDYTTEQKKTISSIRKNIIIKYLDVWFGYMGRNSFYFSDLSLESLEANTEIFDIFYKYQNENFNNITWETKLVRNYFDAINRFSLPNDDGKNREVENAKKLAIISSYLDSKNDLLRFLSYSNKILYSYPYIDRHNKAKNDSPAVEKIQNQLEKDLKIYKPLLTKYLDYAHNDDFRFCEKLINQKLKYSILDELMNKIRKKWKEEKKLINDNIYFKIFWKKYNLDYMDVNEIKNSLPNFKTLIKEQISILGENIGVFKEENIFLDQKNIFYSIFDGIRSIKIEKPDENELKANYYDLILDPGMKAKYIKYEFVYLLDLYMQNSFRDSFDEPTIKNCQTIFDYLNASNYFNRDESKKLTYKNGIEAMVLKNKKSNNQIVSPDFLKFKFVLNKDTISAVFKIAFGENRNIIKFSKEILYNNNEIANFYYDYSSENNTLDIYLLKNSLIDGSTTFTQKFDGIIFIDNEENKKKSNPFSDIKSDQIAIFKDSFYIVCGERLLLFEHKTPKGKYAVIEELKNEKIIKIKGIDDKLFVYCKSKNAEKLESKLGIYETENKTFKYILRNDGASGKSSSNIYISDIFSFYKYNETFYLSLDAKDSTSSYSNKKVICLDLKNEDYQIICGLKNDWNKLYFCNNKIFYFESNTYFCKDLANKKDFIRIEKGWLSESACLPIKSGILYSNPLGEKNVLFYYDFETKENQMNGNANVPLYRDVQNLFVEEGMILINDESVFLFPNLKDKL